MRSIRWKLILASSFVVFVPIYLLNRYAIRSFDDFTSTALEEEMVSQAFMLGEQYRSIVLQAPPGEGAAARKRFAATLTRYSVEVQSRLQVLSAEGTVIFDSDANSLIGANFSGRKEIDNAMRGGDYEASWRLTPDRKYVFYYVPLPVLDGNGNVAAIVYVTHHTGQITKAIMTMMFNQRLAMVVALLCAVLISAILAHTLTRRLRRLTKAAMAYAKGNAPLDLQIKGRDEIGELGSALDRMATDIEKQNDYNREFVSTVMHELRTPITAIKGAAEVLQQGAAEKEDARDKFLANIRYEADRLTRMVGELNELTKLDVETLRGNKESVNYCSCVREILERLMPTFDQEHANLEVSVPDDTITAMLVPGRIEQVISNLLENAFRYTPVSGTVELAVARHDDGSVITTVSDTGKGIPATAFEKVFDRFYTTEPKDVPRDYGSGLGLAVAKSIIENHQGRIWAESSEGQGSRFMFTLPVID
ncbi:ATP-binding protein [Verrucomicrobiota bacterium]